MKRKPKKPPRAPRVADGSRGPAAASTSRISAPGRQSLEPPEDGAHARPEANAGTAPQLPDDQGFSIIPDPQEGDALQVFGLPTEPGGYGKQDPFTLPTEISVSFEPPEWQGGLPPVRHSPSFRSLYWFGEIYYFGEEQAKVIAKLFGAWLEGIPVMHVEEIFDKQIVIQEKIVSNQEIYMSQVFRDNPAWKTLVAEVPGRRGFYSLRGPRRS